MLHKNTYLQKLEWMHSYTLHSLCVSPDVNSKSARVLVILVVPGHLLFLYTIHLLQGGHIAMTPVFIICYLSAALLQVRETDNLSAPLSFGSLFRLLSFEMYPTAVIIQVVILLYVASLMVQWLWRRGLDPDNFSIPYLTALGDLLGTGLLALSFRLILMVSPAGTGV